MPLPLQVQGLTKVYRRKNSSDVTAVNDLSFSVSVGECFGLLGPNGAGKSTSMKCIIGFYPPTRGEVRILGTNVHQNPRQARLSLGVCAQEDTLDTDFTALDQMIQYATFFGINKSRAKERSLSLLTRFGILNKKDELVETLSGGMRRRLQVARSLINDPKLLVLDEPTTGLDPEARHNLWSVLAEERKKGVAILLSTHYMEEAERLCNQVSIIHLGKILKCDSPQKLISEIVGNEPINDEIRPGYFIKRPPNLEDVYLALTSTPLGENNKNSEERQKGNKWSS